MANEGDQAQTQMELADVIRYRQILHRRAATRKSSAYCIDCDDYIIEARQRATGGTERCTECQDISDRRSRR